RDWSSDVCSSDLPLPPKIPPYCFRCDIAYQEIYREGDRLQQYQLPFQIDLAFPVGCVKPMDKPASSQSSRADVYILLCSHWKCCGPLYKAPPAVQTKLV